MITKYLSEHPEMAFYAFDFIIMVMIAAVIMFGIMVIRGGPVMSAPQVTRFPTQKDGRK